MTDYSNIQGWHRGWSQQKRQKGEPRVQESTPAEKWCFKEKVRNTSRLWRREDKTQEWPMGWQQAGIEDLGTSVSGG